MIRELTTEMQTVTGRGRPVVDAVLAPIAYAVGNAVGGVAAGASAALGLMVVVIAIRLLRRSPIRFALAGAGGVAIAAGAALAAGRPGAFFVPGVVSGYVTAAAAVVSLLVGRPLAAISSEIVRGWPAAWYRRPDVHPAYREVTAAWAVFFAGRSSLQWALLAGDTSTGVVTAVRVGLGWPALVLLLAGSYLYGRRRLRRLGGPGVDEHLAGAEPPFRGQPTGF